MMNTRIILQNNMTPYPIPTIPPPRDWSDTTLIVVFLVGESVIIGTVAAIAGADLTLGKLILVMSPLAGSLSLAWIMGRVSKKRRRNGNTQGEDPGSKTSS